MAISEELRLAVTVDANSAITQLEHFKEKTKQVGINWAATSASMMKYGKILSLAVTAPLMGLGVVAVKSAADLEMQQAAFETMLGSAEDAQDLLSDLRDLAAKTPFELKDLTNASKTMLGFGVNIEDLLPYLKQLGDVSGGSSARFGQLALAFSQIQATGRLMGQDLLQLINAGFNPLQVIAQKTGETMAEVKERMSAGGVSAQEVADAFAIATSEGGRFYEGMEKASQTLSGRLSTLKDDLVMLGISFAEIIMPTVKAVVEKLADFIKWLNSIDEGTKKFIITAAGIAVAIGPALIVFAQMIKAIQGIGIAIKVLSLLMNATVMGTPVGLIIAAVAALAAAVYLIIKNWGPISEFFTKLWEKVKTVFVETWETIKGYVVEKAQAIFGWLKENWPLIVSILTGPIGIAVYQIIKHWDDIKAVFQRAFDFIKGLMDNIRDWLKAKVEAIIQPFRDIADAVTGIFSKLKDKLVGHSIIPDMVDAIIQEMDRLPPAMRESARKSYDALVSLQDGIAPFTDALGEMVLNADEGWKSFKDAAKDAIVTVIQMLAKMAFARAAIEFASLNIPGGIAMAAAGTAAMIAAGVVNALGEGGIVTKPTMALVGEKGPEAVIPLNRAGGMVGGGITVIVNGSVMEEEGLARKIGGIIARQRRGY